MTAFTLGKNAPWKITQCTQRRTYRTWVKYEGAQKYQWVNVVCANTCAYSFIFSHCWRQHRDADDQRRRQIQQWRGRKHDATASLGRATHIHQQQQYKYGELKLHFFCVVYAFFWPFLAMVNTSSMSLQMYVCQFNRRVFQHFYVLSFD